MFRGSKVPDINKRMCWCIVAVISESINDGYDVQMETSPEFLCHIIFTQRILKSKIKLVFFPQQVITLHFSIGTATVIAAFPIDMDWDVFLELLDIIFSLT